MKFFLSLAAVGLAAAASQVPLAHGPEVPGENPLTFCEAPDDDILTITKVDLDPNPPEKGKDLLITATGTLSEEVDEGSYVLLNVKYGLITLIKANESLCEQLEKVDQSCPLSEGDLTFQKTVQLPTEIPPGKFSVHADVYSKYNKRITCMEALGIQFSSTMSDSIIGGLFS